MENLKYLFTVVYKDGSVFNQTDADVSAVDPLKSAFFDVKLDEVSVFILSDGNNDYSVCLKDGSFIVNDKKFLMHDGEITDYRLVFFRRHLQSFNRADGAELGHEVSYHFGWQGLDVNGKNVQRIMILD